MTISSAGDVTCVQDDVGAFWCFGSNAYGQLGLGVVDAEPHPIPQVADVFVDAEQISIGSVHGCGIWNDSSVRCWGFNGMASDGIGGGQLGFEPDNCEFPACPGHPTPQVVDVSDVVSVRAGSWHSCGRTNAGSVSCWGMNRSGELGQGTVDDGAHPQPQAMPSVDSAQDVSCGNGQTCIRVDGGDVRCFGSVDGVGDVPGSTIGSIPSSSGIDAQSWRHACAVSPSGDVSCWGNNARGQLGQAPIQDAIFSAELVPLPGSAQAVRTGTEFTCALSNEGEVYCWGSDSNGQLGRGVAGGDSQTPDLVAGLSTVRELGLGGNHACAITDDGELFCWGKNDRGQLGNGTTDSVATPTKVVF